MIDQTSPPEYYLDDLEIGMTFESDQYTITEEEIITFAKQYDPIYFHVDPEAAKKSEFGGLIASGWNTAGIAQRLSVQGFMHKIAGIVSPGIEKMYFLKPVFPGDTLRVASTITEVKPSQSKPDRGVFRYKHKVFNQNDVCVMTIECMVLAWRRPDTH
ncbi:MAG: MaoC family dehydratase [Gammaproteobacteria bacterium]|nr:MaoC family dehydratase [Gammaproteobacteria bacterium]